MHAVSFSEIAVHVVLGCLFEVFELQKLESMLNATVVIVHDQKHVAQILISIFD